MDGAKSAIYEGSAQFGDNLTGDFGQCDDFQFIWPFASLHLFNVVNRELIIIMTDSDTASQLQTKQQFKCCHIRAK